MNRASFRIRIFSAVAAVATIFAIALSPNAWPAKRIGVYFKTFDPVLINDIENAKRAKEAIKLDEVIFVPIESEGVGLGARDRLLLIRESTRGEQGLKPIPFSALASRESVRAWLEELAGKDGKIIELAEGKNILGLKEYLAARKRGNMAQANLPKIVLAAPGKMSERDYRNNPLLGEAMLPEPAAKLIQRRRWYGRGEERGFYGLPSGIVEWLGYEQRLNDRIENVDVFDSVKESTLGPAYFPENRPIFWIDTVEVPEGAGFRILQAKKQAHARIVFLRGGKRYFRFFVHPASKPYFEKFLGGYAWTSEYLATPTASHRSLVVWNPLTDESPLAVKVSLDAEIGGSNRLLSRSQVERATVMSMVINAIPRTELEEHGIRILDEPLSAIVDAADGGMSVREIPEALFVSGGAGVVPMFSLYSRPSGAEPPIVRLIRTSGLSPREYLERFAIEPLVRQHAWLAFSHGLSSEPHEQNMLMEIRDGKASGVFYYRDLGGFHLVPGLRVAAGRALPDLPKGFDPESLKLERANYVAHAYDYLLHSNFYAMSVAVKPYFPDVTRRWVEKTFAKILSEEIRERTGVAAVTEASMKAAVTKYMDRFQEKVRADCAKLLRMRGI